MVTSTEELGRKRIKRAREQLMDQGGDVMILSPGDNHYYLSGNPEKQVTPRHTFFILPIDEEPFLFLSTNNESNVREMAWVDRFVTWADSDDPVAVLEATFNDLGITGDSTLVLDDQMWATFIRDFRDIVNADFELASEVLMPLRRCKDDRELAAIEEAANIADTVSVAVRRMDLMGMTENEVAAEIDYRMRKRGAEDTAFDTVVASGPNSAKPSYTVGSRTIERGDPVVFDFGAQYDHYLSDQTRTMICGGEPPKGFTDAFEVAREAQEAAIDALEPGVPAKKIDEIARSIITDAGYGENFLHVTGHGIGLGIHEPPFLMSGNYVSEGNEIDLEPGMVVTIEPGIYTDAWGIRIEDDVVVTETGSRRLSTSPHGWEPID
jgi:Xaa-Pro aminopeptidase